MNYNDRNNGVILSNSPQIIESSEKKVRGPYLARLELHQRMREHDMDANKLMGEFANLAIDYFRLFGDKPCCTHDISLFLPTISLEGRQELAGKLLVESGISSTNLPKNVSIKTNLSDII